MRGGFNKYSSSKNENIILGLIDLIPNDKWITTVDMREMIRNKQNQLSTCYFFHGSYMLHNILSKMIKLNLIEKKENTFAYFGINERRTQLQCVYSYKLLN